MIKLNASVLITLLLCAAPASAGSPRRLAGLPEIMETLRAGRSVRAVIDYKQCKLLSLKDFSQAPAGPDQTSDPACELTIQNKPQTCYYEAPESMNAVGGMQLTTWEYFGRGFIGPRAYLAASDAKLISIRGFVLNYGSLKIYDDNTVTVKVNYLKTADEIAPAAQAETPLMVKKEPAGISGKKLAAHEYVIAMDEQFSCSVSSGKDGRGASFFAAP
ncbi:MAG: hypothetical protein WCK76_08215 [Elusimicrobiota bacterium]